MRYLRLFENFDGEIIEVINPIYRNEQKLKVFKSFEFAEGRLKEIEDNLKGQIDDVTEYDVNIIYNTAAHEISKLREQYKTDESLSNFQKNTLGYKFMWDQLKVIRDPMHKKAQDIFRRCKKILNPEENYPEVDSEELYKKEQELKRKIEELEDPALKQRFLPDHLEFANMSWEQLKKSSPDQISKMTKSELQKVIDKALSLKDFDTVDKFAQFFKKMI